jgi:hypothetical protein
MWAEAALEMNRKQFINSIEAWKTDNIHTMYIYGDNHIELSYHDQTTEYHGKKDDVALIANFVGALGWREYLRFTESDGD